MKRKNRKRRICRLVLILGTVIVMILSTAVTAFASSVSLSWRNLGINKSYVYTGDDYTTTDTMERFVANGSVAFCLQCGRKIDGWTGGNTGSISVDYTASVSKDNSKQNQIAYLGWYGASSKSDTAYAYTQMYLWNSLPGITPSGNGNVHFTSSSVQSGYVNWKKGIDEKISTWKTQPSISGNTTNHNITAGENVTLIDSNGVFEDYNAFTYTQDGVTVKHSAKSNQLTVSAAKNCKKDTVVMTQSNLKAAGCQKYTSKAVGNYVYNSPKSQMLATYGFVDPIYMSLSFKVALKSNIALVKTSEDDVVAGLKFNIKSADGAFDQDFVTDDNGKINVEMIDPGEYIVTELETPDKYVQPESQTITLVGGETTSVTFDNVIKRGSFELTKTDFISGELLEHAKFEILNETGDVVYEGVTGEDGKWVTEEIPYGKYTYHETEPPVGFLLDSKVYAFEILEDGQVVKVDIPNMPKVGTWQLYPPDGIERGHIISAPVTGDTQPDIAGYLLIAEIAMLIGCTLVIATRKE